MPPPFEGVIHPQMSLRSLYKRNCHSGLLRPFALLGRSLNKFYENLNYHFESNGEQRALAILAQFPCQTIFDVGANVGQWTLTAKTLLPHAQFFCFEPIPQIYTRLKNLESHENIRTFNVALGAKTGKAKFFTYEKGHELSSVYPYAHQEKPSEVFVEIVSGDDFMEANHIDRIDLLKVDAEGHDLAVLRGFDRALTAGKIGAVQFEYGRINIVSKALLHDFHEYLGGYGYQVGKIYPKSVSFKKYDFSMEDFIGPNFLAIPEKNLSLIEALR